MIRLVFMLRKREQVSNEEFYDYWLRKHAPLVAGLANDLNVLRYVQVHTEHDPVNEAMAAARGGMEPVYDGVAELWFESRKTLLEAFETDAGKKAAALLVEDEAKFIDLAASPLWLAHDYPQVNPTPENILARPRSSLVKLYFPLRSLEAVGDADAQRYWYSNHGPIIRRQAAGSGILRYIQVHRIEDALEAQMRKARGTQAPAYMGHAELWFDRAVLESSIPERRISGQRAIEDESKFIDFSRSSMWLAKEHMIVDHF